MSEDLDDDDDLAMADAWRDYQADLLRPTGVDDPDAVAEAIWQGDLVLVPAEDLAERTEDRDRLASLLADVEADAQQLRDRLGDEREKNRARWERAQPYLRHEDYCVSLTAGHPGHDHGPWCCSCGLSDLQTEIGDEK